MKKSYKLWVETLLPAAILLCFAGCVSRKAYEALKYRKAQEAARRREAEEKIRELNRKLTGRANEKEARIERLHRLEDENARLAAEVNRLEKELEQDLTKVSERKRRLILACSEELRKQTRLNINEETGGLILRHKLLFEPSGVKLRPDAEPLLKRLASILSRPEYQNRPVFVDGHTDARPIKISRRLNPDNWVLGARRAAAVRASLEKAGIAPTRMVVRSYGYTVPVFGEDPRDPRNRRVEICLGEPVAE